MWYLRFLLRFHKNKYVRGLLSLFPRLFFRRIYNTQNIDLVPGDKKIIVCLSFDCDTEKDTEVISIIDNFLNEQNIKAVFAVPGALLETGSEPYKKLVKSGHEFINHGYSVHTELTDKGEYRSVLFYERLSPEEIEREVELGDCAIKSVLEVAPIGFRTPHLGTFQRVSELSFLYSILKKLGYVYSSSTMPIKAYENGLIYRSENGILEVPLTGCFNSVFTPLGTWEIRFATGRRFRDSDYVKMFKRQIDFAMGIEKKVFLNYYYDPSQAFKFEGFYKSIEHICNHKDEVWITTYKEICRKLTNYD